MDTDVLNQCVCVSSVDIVSLRHVTSALHSAGRAKLRLDVALNREEVTLTLNRMFHSVSEEVPDHNSAEAPKKICSLMFGLYDRYVHNAILTYVRLYKGVLRVCSYVSHLLTEQINTSVTVECHVSCSANEILQSKQETGPDDTFSSVGFNKCNLSSLTAHYNMYISVCICKHL